MLCRLGAFHGLGREGQGPSRWMVLVHLKQPVLSHSARSPKNTVAWGGYNNVGLLAAFAFPGPALGMGFGETD